MAKVVRTPDEVEAALATQIRFLQQEAARFDAGDPDEALNLAGTLRTLLHHRPQSGSHALLQQAGLVAPGERRGMHFLDTPTFPRPMNVLPSGDFRLCVMAVGADAGPNHAQFLPVLDGRRGLLPYRYLGFDEWWSAPVVVTPQSEQFTRSRVVLLTANQAGGTHFDPAMDEPYHRLTTAGGIGWQVDAKADGSVTVSMEFDAKTLRPKGTPGAAFLNPAPATVRQIAHEVLESLRGPRRKLVNYTAPPSHLSTAIA